MNVPLNHQLLRLTALLQLEQRARELHGRELEFLIVNETAGIVPYQQAVLWRAESNALVLSGVAQADKAAPYRAWLKDAVAAVSRGEHARELHELAATDMPRAVRAAWPEWFPGYALWCPLLAPDGRLLAGLLLGRADPWSEADRHTLDLLRGTYAQSLTLDGLSRRRMWRMPRRSRRAVLLGGATLLLAVVLALPVRQSAIAPAEVVAIDPAPVRAPFEGVVDAVHVAPNAIVHKGDRLVTLNRTELQTRADVAQKALEMAQAEYAVSSQQALSDADAKARLPVLSGKVEQAAAELAYAKGLLERAVITAPADGIAVFDGATEWIGKPVALGERIMLVASPTHTELEMQVPAANAVTFEQGAEVLFFSNVDPDAPARATVSFASYAAAPLPDGVVAYTFRARFDGAAPERLGLQGTAKIYGARRPLVVWLLRRPIAAVRQWLAL